MLQVNASFLASRMSGIGRIPSRTRNLSLSWQEDRSTGKKWIFKVFKIRKGHNYVFHLAVSAVACKCVFKA